MEKTRQYERPILRRVRLEVRTSVLAVCNTSTDVQPVNDPVPGTCAMNGCSLL